MDSEDWRMNAARPDNLIIMITGKALGLLVELFYQRESERYLVNYCRTFIYDTAIPPVGALRQSRPRIL